MLGDNEPSRTEFDVDLITQDGVTTEDAAPRPVPVSPTDEIRELLRQDQTRLGDVFRGLEEGLTAQGIAERHNVATLGFVYSYSAYIQAAVEGRFSSSASMLKQTASSLRTLVRRARGTISVDAFSLLQGRLTQVEQAVDEVTAPENVAAEEESENETLSVTDRVMNVPGIYAFSYGWYLESPLDPVRGNTLIKVGKAEDVGRRVADHRGAAVRTHMPEPLALLRVYSAHGRNLTAVEQLFHRLLSTAGHDNPRRVLVGRSSEAGKEWFLTNEAFLDACAEACGLKTEYIGGSEFALG